MKYCKFLSLPSNDFDLERKAPLEGNYHGEANLTIPIPGSSASGVQALKASIIRQDSIYNCKILDALNEDIVFGEIMFEVVKSKLIHFQIKEGLGLLSLSSACNIVELRIKEDLDIALDFYECSIGLAYISRIDLSRSIQ